MADAKTDGTASTSSGTTGTTGTTEGTGTTGTTAEGTTSSGTTGGDGTGTTGKTDSGGTGGTGNQGTDGTQGATPKAPEKYDLKIPDGGERFLRTEDLADFEKIARENDWTQEEANAEIQFHIERAVEREKAEANALTEAFKADPEYGGEKLETTKRQAQTAIDRIFPEGHRLRDQFKSLLDRPTVGNNLVVAAFLAEVGKMMGEDSPGRTTGAPAGSTKSAAEKLYDHEDSKKLDGRA